MKSFFSALAFLCVLSVQGQLIQNTDFPDWTAGGTYDGLVYNNSTKLPLTFKYNNVTSNAALGHLIRVGTERPTSYDGNMNGSLILGNQFIWNGDYADSIITHGVFTGHCINVQFWYNKLTNNPLGLISKNENPGLTQSTTGGMFYNYVYGGHSGTDFKGSGGMKVYNNTFYATESINKNWRASVYLHPGESKIPNTNIKVYNNVFYSPDQWPLAIFIEFPDDTAGFRCDYNVYYYGGNKSGRGEPRFKIGNKIVSWSVWRNTYHYDIHSVVINPQLDVNGVPAIPLRYGKDLGSAYSKGLTKNAQWITDNPSALALTTQKGIWQCGAFIDEYTTKPTVTTTR